MKPTRLRGSSAVSAVAGAIMAAALAHQAAAQTEVTVAVPNPSAITWAPLWAAIGEGYMEDEELSVDVQAVDGSSQVLQAMSAGQADIGFPGPGPVLNARARGIDVVFLYNLYPKSLFGILAKPEYSSVEELKGKTIGVGTADGAEVAFARAILSDAGMTEGEDYTFLPVGDGGTAGVAFLRGDVEAYAGAVSDAAILSYRGIELKEITPEKFLGYFGNGAAALRSYIDENPEVIEGFGRAMVLGARFVADPANRETALEHMAAGNPQEGEDREFADTLLDATTERMTPTDAYADEGLGYQPPEHWESWQQSLMDSGEMAEPSADLAAGYSNDYVERWNANE